MSGFFSSITRKRGASFDGEKASESGLFQGTSNNMRFTIQPLPGDTGFSQWVSAMKMVAQLPGGIPPEFRKRLWLTMAERHLAAKGVNWPEVEGTCFSEWSHPADAELGVQIVKDLHRTGCSLFCGEDGQENQALLKRVLLAYARWNKAVGYCQGFNMLAALILQVTEKCESDALKLMIYLIEGVLPDSYFADSLRGLSVDMAVFRELLRTRLPRLSKHLDLLQNASTKDGTRSYEPPLTNVFTMQWFLTLFCNCLPHPTVLRVWDLILLEGNEILLRTALAIWQVLEERILNVHTADEFYCLMGALTRELLEFDLINANSLIRAIVIIGPLTELNSLREHYMYNINPWGKNLPQIVDKQLKLYPKQNIALDISALKKQYVKLKQRQRQAHIIFSAAITRQPPPSAPVVMNHLLLGKSALVPAKRIGPVKGSIPPARQVTPSTLHWKDTPKQPSSSSSSDTELCDEESEDSTSEDEEVKSKSKEKDNLPTDETVFITTKDNTTSANRSATVEIDETSTQLPTDILSIPKFEKYESESDSSDFEQFLADRVKNLGQSIEDNSQGRANTARRNSERALQIIQENSLILHRIMQCQARFSPSPPPSDTKVEENVACSSYSTSLPCMDNTEYNLDNKFIEVEKIDEPVVVRTTETESPIYGSKYSSILEKSKSLDEKYNALILNIPPKQREKMGKTNSTSNIVISQTFPRNDNSDMAHWSPITISVDSPKQFNFDTSDNQTKIISLDNFDVSSKKDTFDAINFKYLNSIPEAVDPSKSMTENRNFDISPYSLISPEKLKKVEDDSTKYLDYLQEKKSSHTFYDYKSSMSNISDSNGYLNSSVYSQADTSNKEVFSPLSDEKYKLPTIDFEKFYSITSEENPAANLEITSPVKTESDLSFSTLEINLNGANSSTTFKAKRGINEENKLTDKDCSEIRHSSIADVCSSSSSKTCYNYLINKNVETKSYDAVLMSPTTENKSKEFTMCLEDKRKSLKLDVCPSSPYLKSSVISPLKSIKSPSISPLKSPSPTYNPFPVPISPRQSKEVPLKLGLYKK